MRWRLLLFAVLAAVAWGYVKWLPPVRPSPAGVLEALATSTVRINTDDPDGDDTELLPMLPALRERRVVALGEATHGTREFFRVKDRLFRFLVRRAAFTTFALEISPESGDVVNRYVRDGAGDGRSALRQFEFWTWQTEEVLALIEWMRAWNVGHPDRPLSFVGINAPGPDRDRRMAANVERVLSARGDGGRLVIWAHNAHVSTADGWMGSHLRGRLGDDLFVLGFEFSSGAFRSRSLSGLRQYDVHAAPEGYYAAELARLSAPIVFLEFDRAMQVPVLAAWLRSPRRSRDIDETFYVTRLVERWHSQTVPWPNLYDGVLFVRHTTAARGLFEGDR